MLQKLCKFILILFVVAYSQQPGLIGLNPPIYLYSRLGLAHNGRFLKHFVLRWTTPSFYFTIGLLWTKPSREGSQIAEFPTWSPSRTSIFLRLYSHLSLVYLSLSNFILPLLCFSSPLLYPPLSGALMMAKYSTPACVLPPFRLKWILVSIIPFLPIK